MRYRRTKAFLLVLALTAISAPHALAGNWAGRSGVTGCTGLNQADDQNHYVYYSNLGSVMTSAMNYTRFYWYDPTYVSTYMVGSPTSTTDAVIFDENYTTYCGYNWDAAGNNIIGLATCVSRNSSNECEKHEIRFDNSDVDGMNYDQAQGVACHEFGHSFGLAHRDGPENGCMKTYYPVPVYPSSHDVPHFGALS